jgi:hypothetical protein
VAVILSSWTVYQAVRGRRGSIPPEGMLVVFNVLFFLWQKTEGHEWRLNRKENKPLWTMAIILLNE